VGVYLRPGQSFAGSCAGSIRTLVGVCFLSFTYAVLFLNLLFFRLETVDYATYVKILTWFIRYVFARGTIYRSSDATRWKGARHGRWAVVWTECSCRSLLLLTDKVVLPLSISRRHYMRYLG
jgi:hypothetical protein